MYRLHLSLGHVGAALLLGAGVIACSAHTPIEATPAPVVVIPPASPVASAAPVASAEPAPDLLRPERVEGAPEGLWTITYPAFPLLAFYQIVTSPKGGFVAAGLEASSSPEKHVILRLSEDGTPRWAARVTTGFSLDWNRDIAVDDNGVIALLIGHHGGLTLNDRTILPGSEDKGFISLLVLDDQGEMRTLLFREKHSSNKPMKLNGMADGFATAAFDLVDSPVEDAPGLLFISPDGRVLRREPLGFRPVALAAGRALVVLGTHERAVKHRGRAVLPPMPPRGRPFLAASFDREGALRWAHRFSGRYVYAPTALTVDERGHVFAAFRYGESHGYADDPFSAAVYELDERGREVHRFTYDPNAALTRLFPAANGMTVLGWFRGNELTFQGKPLGLPTNSGGDVQPALFLRIAPDGRPLGVSKFWTDTNWKDLPASSELTTIADATASGEGFLVVVGCLPAGMTFAGLQVEEGERPRCYIARIRRP